MTVRGDDPGDATAQWGEQRLALFALARLKDVAAARLALLDGGRPRFDWWASTWVAMRLESPELRPVLVAAAASDEPLQRALAARGLGRARGRSAVELLLPLARTATRPSPAGAARARRPSPTRAATRRPRRCSTRASDVVRREALRTLAALAAGHGTRRASRAVVGSRDPWIRAAALGALARTSPRTSRSCSRAWTPTATSGCARRSPARSARPAARSAWASCTRCCATRTRASLPAVLEALRQARGKDALDTLRRHLEHADLGVRVGRRRGRRGALAGGAVRAARSPPGAAGWATARASSRRGSRRSWRSPRRRTRRARGPRRGGARGPVARRARAGGGAAARAGGEAPDPGPEPWCAPPLDYREAMAPYDPRAGVALYTPRAFLKTRNGTIEIHLDVVEAPLTTASFVALARRGFYDGLSFHRVEPGFVVQGGCPRGDGNGGPGYALRCEITRRAVRPRRGRHGALGQGHRRQPVLHHALAAAAPRRRLHALRPGRRGMDVVDRIRPGDVIERVEVWTGE